MGISPDITEGTIIVGLEYFEGFPVVVRFLEERRSKALEPGRGIWYSTSLSFALKNIGSLLGDEAALRCAERFADTPAGTLYRAFEDLRIQDEDRLRQVYNRFMSGQY